MYMYVYRDWALMVDANASHMYFISQDMYIYIYRDWALIVDANATHMNYICQDNLCMYTESGL